MLMPHQTSAIPSLATFNHNGNNKNCNNNNNQMQLKMRVVKTTKDQNKTQKFRQKIRQLLKPSAHLNHKVIIRRLIYVTKKILSKAIICFFFVYVQLPSPHQNSDVG